MAQELGQINTNTLVLEDGDILACWSGANNAANNVNNQWLDRQNGTTTFSSPYVALVDMTITGAVISSSVVRTWDINILVDSGGGYIVIHTVSASAAKSQEDTGLDIDINAGDRLAMRVSGTGNPDYPNCDIYLKSR